jgi:putative transposase
MSTTRRTFKYRLWPNRWQRERLAATLETCRQLYNDALQERREAWKICRQSVTFNMQSDQLPACKDVDPSLKSVYSQVLQDVLRRVDKTYEAFFRRGHGFPRFKGKGWFDSFTYPQFGFSVHGKQLSLSKIGNIKIKLHRPLEGAIKTLTLKNENDKWYVCFSCVLSSQPLPPSQHAVGIDVGLESFATTSDGEIIDNPRWFRAAQKQLRRKQRHMDRCKKRTHVWLKACRQVALLHKHILNQRNDFQHKVARALVNHYGVIAVEDLNIKGLAGGRLAKSVLDAAWSAFMAKLAYKAASAGRVLMKVDPCGTSQQCPCGNPVPKELSQRTHSCRVCGLETIRDHAAALEILRRGLRLASATPATVGVLAEAPGFSHEA